MIDEYHCNQINILLNLFLLRLTICTQIYRGSSVWT